MALLKVLLPLLPRLLIQTNLNNRHKLQQTSPRVMLIMLMVKMQLSMVNPIQKRVVLTFSFLQKIN
jgi:hypothetical protein